VQHFRKFTQISTCFDIDHLCSLVHTPGCICGLCGAIGADDIMTYTPSHNVVEKVVSPVCRCDWCGHCLAYSITFSESLCDSYWDVKPCKEYFCCIWICILYSWLVWLCPYITVIMPCTIWRSRIFLL